MMKGSFDHSAIWSRTKIWRRKRSSVAWACEIRSGKAAVADIEGTLQVIGGWVGTASCVSALIAEDFTQAGHEPRERLGPQPGGFDPEAFHNCRGNPAVGHCDRAVLFPAPSVHKDLLFGGIHQPDFPHPSLPISRAF